MSLAESGSREPVVYIQAKGSSIRFRLDHADGVASRSCAAIDRRAAAMGVVLRDMRVPRSRQPATKSAVS
jgi:hypothetical protein